MRLTTKSSSSGDSIAAWSSSPELERIRAYHASPPEPCRSCELFAVCRGGCQIVSRHAKDGRFAPDPECPRVRLHAESAAAISQ
jgi:radical SAM protein with 4Fe4S-binding SPASM domain